MCTHQCGFTHSIMATWPSSVTCRVESNSAANEWCAATGAVSAASSPITATAIPISARRMFGF
jgi:hypothetical protein